MTRNRDAEFRAQLPEWFRRIVADLASVAHDDDDDDKQQQEGADK